LELKPRNDRQSPVTKLCLAMESLRRTDVGRVKTAKELLGHFFAHDATKATDRVFVHLPPAVRAPIVAAWGIRGAKAALRDDDERMRNVVHDALLAGDLDDTSFEDGLTAPILIDWVPLTEWWAFWRSGKVTGVPAQRALASARELGLFDDRWLLENLEGRGGKLKGTDTICDTLTKEQIVAWVKAVHASGDGSPAGLVQALGWETILAKTAQEALLFTLDALAKKIGLVETAEAERAVRGSEVPGIAIPEFPIEEKTTGTNGEPLPEASASWPELAPPGDMGYALARPAESAKPTGKPPAGGEGDEPITSEHKAVGPATSPSPGK
jgi:hypothetical protein